MLLGIIIGFVIPVGIFLFWMILIILFSSINNDSLSKKFKDDL